MGALSGSPVEHCNFGVHYHDLCQPQPTCCVTCLCFVLFLSLWLSKRTQMYNVMYNVNTSDPTEDHHPACNISKSLDKGSVTAQKLQIFTSICQGLSRALGPANQLGHCVKGTNLHKKCHMGICIFSLLK